MRAARGGDIWVWVRITNENRRLPAGTMISFQTEGEISEERIRVSNLGSSTQQASLGQGWNLISLPAGEDAECDLLTAVRPGDFTYFFYQAPLGVTINWDEDTLRYLPGPGV